MNAIEIQDLQKTYKNKVIALNSLNLNVPKSCILGLLGLNGAGKSTTINILAGILQKTDGRILIYDKEINDDEYEYKSYTGFVLERPHYFEKLSVEEYLEFVGAMYGLDVHEIKKRTNELLELLELQSNRRQWIETYSAGMKKKVSLAAAIIHNPQLLILDEPLEGIDPISVKRIKDILKLMVQNGAAILITSHVLDTIEKICDEIAIINKGEIIFRSKTEEIRARIKNEFTHETYQSLEEIFIDVVNNKNGEKPKGRLSWL